MIQPLFQDQDKQEKNNESILVQRILKGRWSNDKEKYFFFTCEI